MYITNKLYSKNGIKGSIKGTLGSIKGTLGSIKGN